MASITKVYTKDGTPVAAKPIQDSSGNTVVDRYGKSILGPVGFSIVQFSDAVTNSPQGFTGFATSGPFDLQRSYLGASYSPNGLGYSSFVSDFTPLASYALGYTGAFNGIPLSAIEISGGINNFIQSLSNSKVNTSGFAFNNPRNIANIEAGYAAGTVAARAYNALNIMPPQCFLADTPILMADGTEKPIEDIQIGDLVAAFHPDDRQGLGKTVPKKVTRLFRNTTKTIIDLRGLKVTPGHRVLSDNGEWLTIANVLRNDRCIVEDRKSGAVLVRARTGVEAGTLKDTPIRVQFADPRTGMQRHAIVRAGIPAIVEKLGNNKAKLWTLADVLFDEGYTITADGWMILPSCQRFNATPWPASSPLETEMMFDWIVSVDGIPFIPPWFSGLCEEDQAEAANGSPWSTHSPTERTPNRAERRRRASLSVVG